ncbi:MAG: divalent metal cation transporter [Holophagales bacterium]|nr:divalent metal cation transporter [Holophagales bacterium]
MPRLFAVLIGGVIAAAFLGPGTVATAASAGAAHGFELLWALAFATIACFVLQEGAARLAIGSGATLAEALRRRYQGSWRAWAVLALVLLAIVLGCAAYEAGNILGGVAGAQLASGWDRNELTLFCGGVAAALLWLGSTRVVASVLGALVALMGVAFLVTATGLGPSPGRLVSGLLPSFPSASGLLVLGLVGTTVVPYNLFLGSGLARDPDSSDGDETARMRFGLAVAIGLGGLVSMAVLVVGSAVAGPFSFEALGGVLGRELGPWAVKAFGWGLLAAGFSSAITAPWAAAITARGLFARGPDDRRWADHAWRFRGVWIAVLATGLAFGLADVRPVPVILVAQAANGVLLPFVAVFLFLEMNDRQHLGRHANGPVANLVMAGVTLLAIPLGVRGLLRALATVSGTPAVAEGPALAAASAVALVVCAAWAWRRLR